MISVSRQRKERKKVFSDTEPPAQDRFTYRHMVLGLGWLTSTEKMVLLLLSEMAGRAGHAYPRQSTLAERCGVSRNTVNRALNEASRHGWVRKVNRGHGCRYVFPWHAEFGSHQCTPRSAPDVTREVQQEEPPPIKRKPAPQYNSSSESPKVPSVPKEAAANPETVNQVKQAQAAMRVHSETPVDRKHAERALSAAGSLDALQAWSRHRKASKLAHQGAVLMVLKRDFEALAAEQAELEAQQERRVREAAAELEARRSDCTNEGCEGYGIICRVIDGKTDVRPCPVCRPIEAAAFEQSEREAAERMAKRMGTNNARCSNGWR